MTFEKKLPKITFITLFVLVSSLNSFAQQFTINGTAEGFNDGTWLYLKTISGLKFDSAEIKKRKFEFNGKILGSAEGVILHTEKMAKATVLYIEPKVMTVSLKNDSFKDALLKGSSTQDEYIRVTKILAPIRNAIDSLQAIVKVSRNDPTKMRANLDEIGKFRLKEKEAYIDYIKNNSNQFIALHILRIYAPAWGKEKAVDLYKNLNIKLKGTTLGKELSDFLAFNQTISIGTKYIDFEQPNANGKSVKLSGIKAKYILLDFWASWCGPCRSENPNLIKNYAAYKSKGFEIIGISADSAKQQWLKAINDDKLIWENVSDLKAENNLAILIYGINSFPTNFLIDEKGIIIAKNLRGENLSKKLAELLP